MQILILQIIAILRGTRNVSFIIYHILVCILNNYLTTFYYGNKSNRKAMNRNWSDQKANPALKAKREINKYYK